MDDFGKMALINTGPMDDSSRIACINTRSMDDSGRIVCINTGSMDDSGRMTSASKIKSLLRCGLLTQDRLCSRD